MSTTSALERASKNVGGKTALSRLLGISQAAVSQWDEVPHKRVLEVEKHSGVPRWELRPDLYPPPESQNTGEAA